MTDLEWMAEKGFRYVGRWADPEPKLQRDDAKSLTRTPGIYVFLVNDKIHYIGMTKRLRGRLRNYNRAFGVETSRGYRAVHEGMRDIWHSSGMIDVWVSDYIGGGDCSLEELEQKWIGEKQPIWNGTGKGPD